MASSASTLGGSRVSKFSLSPACSQQHLPPLPPLPLLDPIQLVPRQFTSTCEPLTFLRRIDRLDIPRIEIADDGVVLYHVHVFLHHETNRIPSNRRQDSQFVRKHHQEEDARRVFSTTRSRATSVSGASGATHPRGRAQSQTTTMTTPDQHADLVVMRRFSDFTALRKMLWELTSSVPLDRNSGYSCSCYCDYCGAFRKLLTKGFCRQPSWLMRLFQHNLQKRSDQLQEFLTEITLLACMRTRNCKCRCLGHERIPSLLDTFLSLNPVGSN